jgi:hypothetical protein
MDEINELLQAFGREGYVSPEDLQTVAQVVTLLVAKIEILEETINTLTSKE